MVAPSTEQDITLSVIVPILNEADRIEQCLASLRGKDIEIIIADGGSSDGSLDNLPPGVSRVVHCPRGRARQMNAGAAVARGRLLAFLHVDTCLEGPAWRRLQILSASAAPVWGRFDVRLSGPGWIYRLIGACMNIRSRISSICTGDQVLFVSADLFKICGGFPEIALMEDIAMSKLLAVCQPPLCCREKVTTSSRRWRHQGVYKTIVLMWRLRLAYFFGADPEDLAGIYYRKSRS